MSWALVWVGKPLMWTTCDDDEVLPGSEQCLELSVSSLPSSVRSRENIINTCNYHFPHLKAVDTQDCAHSSSEGKTKGPQRTHMPQDATHGSVSWHRSFHCHSTSFLQKSIQAPFSVWGRSQSACDKAHAFAFAAFYLCILLYI